MITTTKPAQQKPVAVPADTADDASKRWIARQPIFDQKRQTYGYELLFRGPWRPAEDGSRATAHVINEMVNVIGLRSLLGGRVGFVNLTRQMLLDGDYQLLPNNAVVIELLEDVLPDEDVLEACKRLKSRGYRLALDDFIDAEPDYRRLVKMADIVKIEYLGTTPEKRRQIVKELSRPGLTWLAEKVETHEQFEEAVKLNCAYVQGFFFCAPQQMHASAIPANKQNYLRLVHAVNDIDFDFARIEQIIRHEVSLSAKLLNYLNSAAVGLSRKIDSIHQALTMLGERPLRRWAALAAMTCLSEDKPAELLRMTLVRARFCEQVGLLIPDKTKDVDMFFMGLLSTMGALLNRPMDEILMDMPVGVSLKVALLGGDSPAGRVNKLGLAFERGEEDGVTEFSKGLQLEEGRVYDCWTEAWDWTAKVL